MSHPADPNTPRPGAEKTDNKKEAQDHAGTLGGQRPLNVPAGVQSTGHGGVLVEEGKQRRDK